MPHQPRCQRSRWQAAAQERHRPRQVNPGGPETEEETGGRGHGDEDSLVSIEPTTLRGSSRPLAMMAGVPTGPHPPPPVASTKPATRPRGIRNRERSGWPSRSARTPATVNRTRRYAPNPSRITAITGAANALDTPDRTVAPTKAPTAPGMPTRHTTPQSTLPNLQWDTPEATVVPISATCTVAEATAGLVPRANNKLVEVNPVRHAQTAVDELGTEPDEGEEDDLEQKRPSDRM